MAARNDRSAKREAYVRSGKIKSDEAGGDIFRLERKIKMTNKRNRENSII